MKALGIDPGTANFDLCCIEDEVDKVILDETISSSVVAHEPERVLQLIMSADPDVVVGPSGYGVAFKLLSQAVDEDLALTTLEKRSDGGISVLSGVRRLLRLLKNSGLNVYMVPGVIQLPTIPIHRKSNRIDMGTADKTCVTAYAIWDQARRMDLKYNETRLICVEMGYGYNAAMAVENGEIVDGVGGTIFPGPGYLSMGLMDGELAYLLGEFTKPRLFQGGASFIASNDEIPLERFTRERWGVYALGWKGFLEGVLKAVAQLLTAMDKRPYEVILTGRLSRIDELRNDIQEMLGRKLGIPVRRPSYVFTRRAKDVAMGAALIADGVGGGKYSGLVDTLKIKESHGTVLDHVFLQGFDKEQILKGLRSD